ncbi:MAG: caspase family protein [Bacteroidota bacterium]
MRYKWLIILILATLLGACSSTKWVVLDEPEVDQSDYKLLRTDYLLQRTSTVTTDAPVLVYSAKTANTYEYAKRLRTDRYIQRYRPRWGYVLLGTLTAGLITYSAHSELFIESPSTAEQNALTITAAAVMGVSLLNMKPLGEPRPTGESRLLRKVGTTNITDTLSAVPATPSADIRLRYNDQLLLDWSERTFVDDKLYVNFVEELNPNLLNGDDGDAIITVDTRYINQVYTERLPLASIFDRFIEVISSVTPLRNTAENFNGNILTDLAQGSQLKLLEAGERWHKVQYGLTEAYISVTDVRLSWRPSQFASQLSIITVPNIPFGNVDIERNIPELGRFRAQASAFLLTNQNYTGRYEERTYAQRDARLMEEYMTNTLGVNPSKVSRANNISSNRQLVLAFNQLVSKLDANTTQLLVFLSGYTEFDDGEWNLVAAGDSIRSDSKLSLKNLFEGIAQLPVDEIIVFADLDMANTVRVDDNTAQEELAGIITNRKTQSAVIFASNLDQRSYLYSVPNGEQKRHSVFTYFLAESFKQGKTDLEAIIEHLERNVTFTSRRLFDLPQDINAFGNTTIQLVD